MKAYEWSPGDIAKGVHKSTRWVIRQILRGQLPAIRVGRTFRVSEEDLSDFLERSKVVPAPEYSEEFVSNVAAFEHEQAERYCEDKNT